MGGWQQNPCAWVCNPLIHLHTKFERNRTISKFRPIRGQHLPTTWVLPSWQWNIAIGHLRKELCGLVCSTLHTKFQANRTISWIWTNQRHAFAYHTNGWQRNICGCICSPPIHLHIKFERNRTISKFRPIRGQHLPTTWVDGNETHALEFVVL